MRKVEEAVKELDEAGIGLNIEKYKIAQKVTDWLHISAELIETVEEG